MRKQLFFTGALVVILAFIATACKLPASSSPPTATTQEPVVPTSTTGVVVVPTSTSIPPIIVVETEAASPTPLLPTPEPPTPAPPTATPLPAASRIQFAAGSAGAVIDGNVDAGQTIYYVLHASTTQTMSIKVSSPNGDVFLGVTGADGQVLLSSASNETIWSGTLTVTQDYYLSLTAAGGSTSFSLSVEIPPLQITPTANVTPVPGTFNPVATYGNPTFEDPMTGGNINDWTNPVTGLLPNTNYIRITETGAKFYVTGKIAGFSTWYFTWHELSDFYLQSTFDSGSCTGKDAYGLIVRGPEHLAGVSYGYIVAFSCDGQFWVFRLDGANPFTTKELVSWTASSYIVAGANQQNVMGIKAIGDTLTVYANGHQIAEVTDSKYGFGRYGVFVSPELTSNYMYRVMQMSYWDLKP